MKLYTAIGLYHNDCWSFGSTVTISLKKPRLFGWSIYLGAGYVQITLKEK